MGEKQDRWDGKTLPFGEDCYDYCRRVFFNRWKPRIIHAIQFDNDCTRFSRFTRQLPISEKVLAQNLRSWMRTASSPGRCIPRPPSGWSTT